MLRLSFIGTLIFFCVAIAHTQDHDYIQYTTKDGLPTNYVYGVLEDNEGYIWAYTENGLAKFDGYNFQHFSTKDGLPGNDIVYALKDDRGKLWLQTYNSQAAFVFGDSVTIISDDICAGMSLVDGNISYSCQKSTLMYNENEQVNQAYEVLLDTFLLQQEPEVFYIDSIVAKTDRFDAVEGLRGYYYIHEEADSIYYYSIRRLSTFRFFPDEYIFVLPFSGKIYFKNKEQRKVLEIKQETSIEGTLWSSFIGELGTNEKYLVSYNNNTLLLVDVNKDEVINLNAKYAFYQFNLSTGNISILKKSFLVSSRNGFYELDFNGNLIDSVKFNVLAENYSLLRFYKDSKGNVWAGSREGGLFLIPKNKRKTQRLTSFFSKDKAFEGLYEMDGGTLLGVTDNTGVYKIDGEAITQIHEPDKSMRFRSGVETPSGFVLSSSEKSLILNERNNEFDFQAFSQRFSIRNDAYYQYLKERNLAHLVDGLLNRVSMIYSPKDKSIYSSGSAYFVTEHRLEGSSTEVNLKLISIRTLSYDSFRKRTYAANSEGVFLYENGQLIPFINSEIVLKNIASLYVNEHSLWIGTESDGLYVYAFETEKLSKKSTVEYIRNIKETPSGEMLVASNEGVFVFNNNPDDKEVVAQYTINDGLSTNEIQDVYATNERYIYVASSEGIDRIDRHFDDAIDLDQNDLKITDVQVNKKGTSLKEKLDLAHDQNTIDIQYHLRSFASNGKVNYYTKLEPLEKEWRESNSLNVNYLSLPPDDYTFHLRAKDIYGNEVVLAPMSIVIRKAYWQTTWFKVLLSLLTLGLIIALIRQREENHRQKLNKEKEIERRMAALELSALKAQMNPHFVFNALGAIQYFIQTNDVESADNYLTRFARLMRKYLDSSKERMVSVKDEVELLSIYTDLEKLRFEDLFSVEIKIAESIRKEDTFLPSMMVQPFVENAINHGLNERRDKKGLLQIHFTKKYQTLYCTITDNGVGRKNAQKNQWKGHQSRGMQIINDKIETLSVSAIADVAVDIKDLNPTDTTFPGTKVTLKLKNLEDE